MDIKAQSPTMYDVKDSRRTTHGNKRGFQILGINVIWFSISFIWAFWSKGVDQ